MTTLKTKFSPGPWVACFTSFDRMNVAFEITARPHGSIRPVAERPHDEDNMANAETLTADAHLIAAAPDLYEALRRLDENGHTDATWEFAKRAMAKARGEQL